MTAAAARIARAAVVGACQTGGVAAAMRRLLADCQVDGFTIGAEPGPDGMAAALRDYDLVVAVSANLPSASPLHPARLEEAGARVLQLPSLYYSGFHPDCTYVLDGGVAVKSPSGDYHSALVCAGFLLGLAPGRVEGLFNRYVYARCGYLDRRAEAGAFLLQQAGDLGLDLRSALAGWEAAGVFMHSVNHPHVHVIFDVVRAGLARAGIDYAADAAAEGMKDGLADAKWPVYPGITGRSGGGPIVFHRRAPGKLIPIALPDFVTGAYAIYEGLPPSALIGRELVQRVGDTLRRVLRD